MQWAFNLTGGPRLQSILLLADTRMRRRYDEIAACLPAHSVIDKIHMTPLTEKQTAAYLRHRMKQEGRSELAHFSEKQIRSIHRSAKGWPGSIDHEAANLLSKKRGTPLFESYFSSRIGLFHRKVNNWTKRIGFQNLKRNLNLDPTPWVP